MRNRPRSWWNRRRGKRRRSRSHDPVPLIVLKRFCRYSVVHTTTILQGSDCTYLPVHDIWIAHVPVELIELEGAIDETMVLPPSDLPRLRKTDPRLKSYPLSGLYRSSRAEERKAVHASSISRVSRSTQFFV